MSENGILYFLIWNIIVFLLYGIDKWKAIRGKWRISEKTLICAAFLMGAIGALAGIRIFRHKTQKPVFLVLVILAAVLNAGVLIMVERI